jgi:hypothetical protein
MIHPLSLTSDKLSYYNKYKYYTYRKYISFYRSTTHEDVWRLIGTRYNNQSMIRREP